MAETYASAVRMPTHYTTDATTRTCGSGGSSGRPVLISRRLTRMLFGQRHGVSPTGAPNVDAPAAALAADLTAERQRWEQERKMLLEDCTSMRAEAAEAERMLQGWSSMIRDLLFYGFFYGRQQAMLERLTETLHDAVGEIDGVNEVEVTEFRLPAAPDFVPHLALTKYCGPELSEWMLRWEPPSIQAGGSICLRGRKFGVSFSIVVAVSAMRLHGPLVLRWNPEDAEQVLHAAFKKMPNIGFDVSLAGKALSLGSDTLRAWLTRQLERALASHCVLPQTLDVGLPFPRDGGFVASAPQHIAGSPSSSPADGRSATAVGSSSCHEVDRSHSSSTDSGWNDDAVQEDLISLRQLLALRTDSFLGPTWLLNAALAQLLCVPLVELESRAPTLKATGGERVELDDWATGVCAPVSRNLLHFHASCADFACASCVV